MFYFPAKLQTMQFWKFVFIVSREDINMWQEPIFLKWGPQRDKTSHMIAFLFSHIQLGSIY